MLAVKLSNDRAQLWQAYLSTILTSWTAIPTTPIQGDGYTGWELKKHVDPNLIRFIHAGDWVLFGWGQDDIHLQPSFLQRIKANKRPADPLKNVWLDALVDFADVECASSDYAARCRCLSQSAQGASHSLRAGRIMSGPR